MLSVHRLVLLALAGSSYAFPFLRKRQVESQMNDVDILRYALTLEHLESAFYLQGLANFTQSQFAAAGFDSTFYTNLLAISSHEAAHVQFLTAALQAINEAPTEECTYAFGVTSVEQFVATANIFEGIGVSAYLGAASHIVNKGYLTAAGSILTIEARHNAYLRASLSESPFPQSQDDPLTPDEVHTMAHNFIVSCPTNNPSFPVKAFPGLTVTTTGTITTGQSINVQTSGYVASPSDANAQLYAAFVTANGPAWTPMTKSSDGIHFQVTVPAGVNGQSYLLFNNCNDTVSDSTVVAGPTLLEVASHPIVYAS